jgi:hypothetical protein
MLNKISSSLGHNRINSLVPLFLPWVISEFLNFNPLVSFGIAWVSAFFIFAYSVKGPLKSICPDLPLKCQVMRPLVLIQMIFVGLMSATSIFHFIDHLGFYFLTNAENESFTANSYTYQLAYCQRLYLFAHASLVFGMILLLKPNDENKRNFTFKNQADSYLLSALGISILIITALESFSSLLQFAVILSPIPKCLAALILLKGLRFKRPGWILLGILVFGYNLYQSSLTGYKEGIFVQLIILGFVFYPFYSRMITILAMPVIVTLIYILPTWTNTMRAEAWVNESSIDQAKEQAYAQVFDDGQKDLIERNSWEFLTGRFSEINMFSKYVANVPAHHPFYGFSIFEDALYALIPRALWPEKPITEETSMERVYEAAVVNPNSDVSAKTRTVVDGYLSAGRVGIFITMILYGLICQSFCNKAEILFGGYETGCIIVFNGMFQQLWRGNNFEFILNNIVYGYLIMMMTFYILKHAGILIEKRAIVLN